MGENAGRGGWRHAGEYHSYGGSTPYGMHFSKSYEDSASTGYSSKVPYQKLSGAARAAVAWPPKRQIDGVRLTNPEWDYIKLLSCKSRAVFWLYYKMGWPARDLMNAYGPGFLDQHTVYIRNRAIKTSMAKLRKPETGYDGDLLRSLLNEGNTIADLATYFNLSEKTVLKHVYG